MRRDELDLRWHERAACAEAPTDLFFAEERQEASTAEEWSNYVALITADYCAGCPVRLECLAHAMTFTEKFGIWAGSTPEQRAAWKRTKASPSEALSQLTTEEQLAA